MTDATLILPDGTRYEGRLRLDDNGEPIVDTATCGECGFSWNDALCTSVTPTPSGRCPNEYGHAPEELTEAERFFYYRAGYSYGQGETEQEGRERCARDLAAAEVKLTTGPYYVEIEPDDVPWDGDVPYDGPLWTVALYRVDDRTEGELIAFMGSVACEQGDEYLRVVAAELASENL